MDGTLPRGVSFKPATTAGKWNVLDHPAKHGEYSTEFTDLYGGISMFSCRDVCRHAPASNTGGGRDSRARQSRCGKLRPLKMGGDYKAEAVRIPTSSSSRSTDPDDKASKAYSGRSTRRRETKSTTSRMRHGAHLISARAGLGHAVPQLTSCTFAPTFVYPITQALSTST